MEFQDGCGTQGSSRPPGDTMGRGMKGDLGAPSSFWMSLGSLYLQQEATPRKGAEEWTGPGDREALAGPLQLPAQNRALGRAGSLRDASS